MQKYDNIYYKRYTHAKSVLRRREDFIKMCQNMDVLKKSVTAEMFKAIEKAENGQLSPHWQRYCMNEMKKYEGTLAYPDHGDELVRKLKDVVEKKNQISNQIEMKQQMEQAGAEVLFSFDDHDEKSESFLNIAFTPLTGKFTCEIGVDRDLSQNEYKKKANEMKQALQRWLEVSGKDWNVGALSKGSICAEQLWYDSLTEAIVYLFSALNRAENVQ